MLAVRRHAAALWLAPLAYLVLFHGLGRYGLVNGDEGFYHVVARTMVETGNFFRLDFQGEPRLFDTFLNAPLQYWGRALAIAALGDGRVAMRIQSALFGLASVVLAYACARRLAGPRAGLLTAGIQLTTYQLVYVHGARTGELETATAFFFTSVAFLFVRWVETGRGLVLHHVCWVLLANWKLPLFFPPLIAEALAFALLPAARARFVPWLRCAVLLLPLGFAWHVGQLVANRDGFLEVAGRMLSQASEPLPGLARHGPARNASYYLLGVLFGAFPWSLLYPFALASLLRTPDSDGRARFVGLGLFVASLFGFFVLVERHAPWYWTPALPLLSLFVGVWLARVASGSRAPSAIGAAVALATGLAVIDVALVRANPFAARVAVQSLEPALRSGLGLPPLLEAAGVAAAAAAGVLGFCFVRPRSAPTLAVLIYAAAFGVGALRVLMPLRHLDHRTEMARLREEIDAARLEGRELPLPLPIQEGGELKVRALFARDFEIVPGCCGVRWWLYPPGDPRAKGSIRRGLRAPSPRQSR